MRLQVTSVLLALFAGCIARAGIIEFNDVITSGEATYYWTHYQPFTASVQGPAMEATFNGGNQDPFNGVSVGGDTPYCCNAEVGFVADGLNLGCAAYSGSPNCVAGMRLTLTGTATIIGFNDGFEVETQPFVGDLYVSGCEGPGCINDSCYATGTTCFDGYFSGGGTATITLYPVPTTPGLYAPYEAVFDFVAIPEPSSIALAALGLAGIALARRRN